MIELIKNDIRIPGKDECNPYLTEGKWSLYDLIGYLCQHTGKAKVIISTFSISEDSLRFLLNLKAEGMITHLTGLFDPGMRKTKTALLLFAAHVFDEIRFLKNHSKIVVMEGESNYLVVVTTSNLGKNKRIEAGYIDGRKDTLTFFNQKLSELLTIGFPL